LTKKKKKKKDRNKKGTFGLHVKQTADLQDQKQIKQNYGKKDIKEKGNEQPLSRSDKITKTQIIKHNLNPSDRKIKSERHGNEGIKAHLRTPHWN
jgi:hypothetical protein